MGRRSQRRSRAPRAQISSPAAMQHQAELQRRVMVIGGVAVIAYGVPRTTLDVDATIDVARLQLEQLVKGRTAQAVVVPRGLLPVRAADRSGPPEINTTPGGSLAVAEPGWE